MLAHLSTAVGLPTAGRQSSCSLYQGIRKPGYGGRGNDAPHQQEDVRVDWRQRLEGCHCDLYIQATVHAVGWRQIVLELVSDSSCLE